MLRSLVGIIGFAAFLAGLFMLLHRTGSNEPWWVFPMYVVFCLGGVVTAVRAFSRKEEEPSTVEYPPLAGRRD